MIVRLWLKCEPVENVLNRVCYSSVVSDSVGKLFVPNHSQRSTVLHMQSQRSVQHVYRSLLPVQLLLEMVFQSQQNSCRLLGAGR